MELTVKIDTRNKSAKNFLKYMLSLPFIKVLEKRNQSLTDEDKKLLDLMKEAEETGYLTDEETEKLFENV